MLGGSKSFWASITRFLDQQNRYLMNVATGYLRTLIYWKKMAYRPLYSH